MSLDERVRVGLRRSADTGRLDEDEVFDQIRTAYERGVVRARVLRQATTVAIVLTLIAGIGVFVSLRAAPDRYRTTSTVAVSLGATGYPLDPLKIALAPSTQRAALRAGRITPPEKQIHFGATSSIEGQLSLAVTAPSTAQSTLVTRNWVAVLTRAMNDDTTRRVIAKQRALALRTRALIAELHRVDRQLMKMDPIVYGGVLKFDSPTSTLPGTQHEKAPPPVPEQGPPRELNLAFLRIQILSQITHLGKEASQFRYGPQEQPNISARTVGPTSTIRVSHTPRATWVTLSGWLVALLLVLIGGVFVYRRRSASASPTRT